MSLPFPRRKKLRPRICQFPRDSESAARVLADSPAFPAGPPMLWPVVPAMSAAAPALAGASPAKLWTPPATASGFPATAAARPATVPGSPASAGGLPATAADSPATAGAFPATAGVSPAGAEPSPPLRQLFPRIWTLPPHQQRGQPKCCKWLRQSGLKNPAGWRPKLGIIGQFQTTWHR
jgi:hypothetical protein